MKPKTEAVYPQHRGRQQARRGHPAAQSERLPERGLVSRPAADLRPSRPRLAAGRFSPTPSPSLSPPSPQSLGCTMAAGSTVDQTTHILNIVCMPLAEDLGNGWGFGRAGEDLADEGGRSHGPPAPRPAPRSQRTLLTDPRASASGSCLTEVRAVLRGKASRDTALGGRGSPT